MKASSKTAIVRLATDKDIPSLVELENRCFETDRLNAAHLRRFIHSSTSLTLVCEDHQQIIADAIILFRKRSTIARLYSIAVHPDRQGHGYATLLHQAIEAAAQQHSCKEIRLEVRYDNPQAIHFYTQLGYTRLGEYKQFYEDGANALRMIKVLINQ